MFKNFKSRLKNLSPAKKKIIIIIAVLIIVPVLWVNIVGPNERNSQNIEDCFVRYFWNDYQCISLYGYDELENDKCIRKGIFSSYYTVKGNKQYLLKVGRNERAVYQLVNEDTGMANGFYYNKKVNTISYGSKIYHKTNDFSHIYDFEKNKCIRSKGLKMMPETVYTLKNDDNLDFLYVSMFRDGELYTSLDYDVFAQPEKIELNIFEKTITVTDKDDIALFCELENYNIVERRKYILGRCDVVSSKKIYKENVISDRYHLNSFVRVGERWFIFSDEEDIDGEIVYSCKPIDVDNRELYLKFSSFAMKYFPEYYAVG